LREEADPMTARADARELKRLYKETPKEAGIFRITNTVNGMIYLGSSLNLHGPLNKHKFVLSIGSHMNKALQADWTEHGADAFVFEIVEKVKPSENPAFNVEDELSLLEQIWIEKERPFSARGYNEGRKVRE
jgi:group I intron endonuclease